MKILSLVKEKTKESLLGKKFKCSNCRCKLLIDSLDDIREGMDFFHVGCPNCFVVKLIRKYG